MLLGSTAYKTNPLTGNVASGLGGARNHLSIADRKQELRASRAWRPCTWTWPLQGMGNVPRECYKSFDSRAAPTSAQGAPSICIWTDCHCVPVRTSQKAWRGPPGGQALPSISLKRPRTHDGPRSSWESVHGQGRSLAGGQANNSADFRGYCED